VAFVQKQTVFEAQMTKVVLQKQHWWTNALDYFEKKLKFLGLGTTVKL
jgi:hypothetical protein